MPKVSAKVLDTKVEKKRAYRQSPKGIEAHRRWQRSAKGKKSAKLYNQTPKNKAYQKLWQQSLRGKEWIATYRQSQKYKEYTEKFNQSLRGKLSNRIKSSKRRRLTKDLTLATVQQVYEDNIKFYGTLTCYLCLHPIPFGNDHLEHKTPVSRGGGNNKDNLGVSCAHCNRKKNSKTVEEFKNAQN